MRYMGIDYGTKRVGVAFSDEEGNMAFPYDTLGNDDKLLDTLRTLIEEREVGMVVVGHSIHGDGSENVVQSEINTLLETLKKGTSVQVALEPEQYSTKEAERIQGKTEKTDASAAAIILNSYLIREKNKA